MSAITRKIFRTPRASRPACDPATGVNALERPHAGPRRHLNGTDDARFLVEPLGSLARRRMAATGKREAHDAVAVARCFRNDTENKVCHRGALRLNMTVRPPEGGASARLGLGWALRSCDRLALGKPLVGPARKWTAGWYGGGQIVAGIDRDLRMTAVGVLANSRMTRPVHGLLRRLRHVAKCLGNLVRADDGSSGHSSRGQISLKASRFGHRRKEQRRQHGQRDQSSPPPPIQACSDRHPLPSSTRMARLKG